MGIRALAHGVSAMPCGAQALATMKPETRHALENPSSASWHDGSVVIDAAEAVQRLAGDRGVEDMNFTAVKQSLGPVLAPFFKVTLSLFGTSPSSLLKRMNDSLGAVMTGVRAEWSATGVTSGRLTITHPDDVKAVSWPCWRGSLRLIFELCGAEGEIIAHPELSSVRTLVFDCHWK